MERGTVGLSIYVSVYLSVYLNPNRERTGLFKIHDEPEVAE